MSARPRAADLRQALIAETLDEVAHLHDTVQALGPKLQAMADPIAEAIAEALTRAKKEVSEHARDQATYVEQTMLRDREKFVTEQKAALQALDTSLRKRDAGIVKIMADILEKALNQRSCHQVQLPAGDLFDAQPCAHVQGKYAVRIDMSVKQRCHSPPVFSR